MPRKHIMMDTDCADVWGKPMLSDVERQMRLTHFIRKYLRRGFVYKTHTEFVAELHRPARFPRWLFPETTLFVDIDPNGNICVSRRRD